MPLKQVERARCKIPIELVEWEEALKINRQIQLKYIMPEGLNSPTVSSYLSKGDDITLKIHMDYLVDWNLVDSEAWRALRVNGLSRPPDE